MSLALPLAAALIVTLGPRGGKEPTVADPGKARLPTQEEACAAKVLELRSYIAALAKEGEVRAETILDPSDREHFLNRHLPAVPLVVLHEAPSITPDFALVALENGAARFDRMVASTNDPDAFNGLVRAASRSILSPYFGSGGLGSMSILHPAWLFVGRRERWADVASFANLAARAGFAQIEFSFEVMSVVAPPEDVPATRSVLTIATDQKQMPWQRDIAATRELARRNPDCPGVAASFEEPCGSSDATQRQTEDFVANAADRVAACACRADFEAIKAFTWTRFGREWGPLTVTYDVELAQTGDEKVAAVLHKAAETPWSEAFPIVLDAAKKKLKVTFQAD